MITGELDPNIIEHQLVYGFNDLDTYKQKVEVYLKQHSDHLTIIKIKNNIRITNDELSELEMMLFDQGELGTKEDFQKAFGQQPLGKFIRSIVGLDTNTAKQAFGGLLSGKNLNSNQIRFIDMIINYFSVKGFVEPGQLFEPPFTDIDSSGIMGVFDEDISTKIIELIEEINNTAVT
jgi:type I restriction enzyme R subunit